MAKQTFTTGQVLTAAQMTSLQQTAMGGGAASTKTASYVLVAADAGTTIAMNAAGATTITVNTNLFAAGDTVFIQNLGAGNCTITAGTATVNTAGSLVLPQYDAGILYFTSASNAIFYDYVQSAAAGGKVLQVVSTLKTDTFSSSTLSTFTDITGMSVSITPSSATSKILVLVNLSASCTYNNQLVTWRLMRDSTAVCVGDAAGSRQQVTTADQGSDLNAQLSSTAMYYDSPATTSALTYKIQFWITAGTFYLNRSPNDTNGTNIGRTASTITVMEIGA